MKLSTQDADLFVEMILPLQYYACRKQSILQNVETFEDYRKSSLKDKIAARNGLFDHPKLIDDFLRENPENLSQEKLFMIAKWKNFVKGEFWIERFLKKYTIFIQEDQVYGVLGLHDAPEERIHRSHLPLLGKTILLPFKGSIVYDGLLETYSIYFGGGIRGDLKDRYMTAKVNDRIIESLEPAAQKIQKKRAEKKPSKEWKKILDNLSDKAGELRGSKDLPPIYTPMFSLIRASIELAQTAVSDKSRLEDLDRAFQTVKRAYTKTEKGVSRLEKW